MDTLTSIKVDDLQLTSTLPKEMVDSQALLIDWCEKKILSSEMETAELKAAYEHAFKHKWKSGTLKRHWALAEKRTTYYVKIREALKEGYYIVPNFPIQIFAIRTSKRKPAMILSTSTPWQNDREQNSEKLPVGEGEFKNPIPKTDYNWHKNEKGEDYRSYFADDWDNLQFPLNMAKPRIMEVTTHAMKHKIFDRIGVMPDYRNRDPVIIGQIMLPKCGYNEKIVSFMIAWHLNTNAL